MNWLPKPEAFRERLAAANAEPDASAKAGTLAALAMADLGFLEIIQLDQALTRAEPGGGLTRCGSPCSRQAPSTI